MSQLLVAKFHLKVLAYSKDDPTQGRKTIDQGLSTHYVDEAVADRFKRLMATQWDDVEDLDPELADFYTSFLSQIGSMLLGTHPSNAATLNYIPLAYFFMDEELLGMGERLAELDEAEIARMNTWRLEILADQSKYTHVEIAPFERPMVLN